VRTIYEDFYIIRTGLWVYLDDDNGNLNNVMLCVDHQGKTDKHIHLYNRQVLVGDHFLKSLSDCRQCKNIVYLLNIRFIH
jgi:hypothetical protein